MPTSLRTRSGFGLPLAAPSWATWLPVLGALATCLGAGAVISLVEFPPATVIGVIAMLCLGMLGLAAWQLRVSRGFPPGIVLALVLMLEYAGKPAYIANTGNWGWDANTLTSLADTPAQFMAALLIALGGVAAAALVLLLAQGRATPPRALAWPTVSGQRDLVVLAIGVSMSLLAMLVLGFKAFDSQQLAIRSVTQSGYFYLPAYSASGAVLAAILIAPASRFATLKSASPLILGALASAFLYMAFLGGRADVIVLLVGVVVLLSYRVRPLRIREFVAIGLVLLVFAVVYRAAVREPFFTRNAGVSSESLVSAALSNPVDAVLSGSDVSAFDALVLLNDRWDEDPLLGETIAAAIVSPVPRGAFAEKPRGGNEVYTERMFPQRYELGAGLNGVSLLGEGYINFGPAGAISSMALFAAALGLGYRKATRHWLWLLIYALLIARIPGVVRGDAYHSLLGIAVPFAWAVGYVWVAGVLKKPKPEPLGVSIRPAENLHA